MIAKCIENVNVVEILRKKISTKQTRWGNIIGKIKNSKITKTLRKHMQSVGQQLGLLPGKKMIVQKGGSVRRMRQGPQKTTKKHYTKCKICYVSSINVKN